MSKAGKYLKKTANKKTSNILLVVLLAACLVFTGTVLGKYILERTLGNTLNLAIAGTPQGNILMPGAVWTDTDEGSNITDGFNYRLQTLAGGAENIRTVVFCGKDELPAAITDWDSGVNVDVAEKGNVKAFCSGGTVYVASENNEKIETNADSAYMFSGLSELKAIEGLAFVDTALAEDMQSMFSYCSSLTSLDLTSFDTSNVTSMSFMFEGCSGLTSLNVSSFDTAQVTAMIQMFDGCSSLKTLDVTGFDTSNVGSMWYTFANCSSLTELDVSGLDTSSVTEMGYMFYGCSSLRSLDVSGFDTSGVTWMGGMFGYCSSLEQLNLTGLETGAVTDMSNMFKSCSSLETLDLSSFDTGSVKTMSSMFSNCSSLNKLYLTDWNTESVTNMSDMFWGCSALTALDLSSFDTANVTTMRYMFADCGSLQTIYVSNAWSTEKVINTGDDGDEMIDEYEGAENELFTNCWSLVGGQGTAYYDIADEYSENYDAENYDDKKYAVIDKAQELQEDGTYGQKGYLTLYEAYTLTAGMDFNLTISTLQMDNPAATGIIFGSYNMLRGELGGLDWDDETVKYEIVDDQSQGTIRAYAVTDDYGDTYIYVLSQNSSVIFANRDCSHMFDWLIWLTYIGGLENVDTRNTTNMAYMFSDCWELWNANVSEFDTGKVTDMSGMFSACKALDSYSLDVSGFDTGSVTNMYGMFANCEALYSLDVSGFDTAKVTNMGSMFASCTGLYELNLSTWNTGNVTNMASMFDDCTSLETIYAGAGWNTGKVTGHSLMFDNCTALVGGQGTAFDANYIDKTYALIDAAREPNGAKGYLTDADYGTKSKILLPGGEFNAELANLLADIADNEAVTKVQFGEGYQFSDVLGFDYWDDDAWAANADAILDVARSGNISAFVVGDTVYIVAKETNDNYQIYANQDCRYMFLNMSALTAIGGLPFVDTSNTTTMASMFSGCGAVSSLDLSGFNTARVTTMDSMFYGCGSLGGLSVGGFDTAKVTDMSAMFYDCDALTALNLSAWNVSGVVEMDNMFFGSEKLNTLNLTGWAAGSVTDMTGMFSGCSALKTIYVDESWTTKSVAAHDGMFTGCTALVGGQSTTLADTGNVVDKTYAVIDRFVSDGTRGYLTYEEAYALVSGYNFTWMLWDGNDDRGYGYGDVQWEVWSENDQQYVPWNGGDIRIVKIVIGTFDEYKDELGLTSWDDVAPGLALDAEQEGNIRLHIPGYDFSTTPDAFNSENPYDPDNGKYGQTYYILSKGSSKIIANEDCSNMFRVNWAGFFEEVAATYSNLAAIEGLEKLDTRYVTNMSDMFNYYRGETLNLSNFNTSSVTDMSCMFIDCSSLTGLDLSGFDTSNVTNMSSMFDGCSSVETLAVNHFDTSKVTNMSYMFNGMGLTALDVSNFKTGNVTNMGSMFSGIGVTELDLSNFDTSNVTNMDGMFHYCDVLTDLNISGFDTGKVTSMEFMFADCHAIKELDISSFSTTGADNSTDPDITFVDIAYMFNNCSSLEVIYASDRWDPDKVGYDYYSEVFTLDDADAVSNLTGGEGTTWAETVGTNSYDDYRYARIDRAQSVGEAEKGLFTDKNAAPVGEFTLKTGTEFNAIIADLVSADPSLTKVRFGSWADYGETNGFEWGDSAAVTVDVDDKGIKAFTSGGTVYILSGGTMYANADSSSMFKHDFTDDNGTEHAKGFIPQGQLTAIDGLASVNTGKVTNMSSMFEYCTSLAVLDVTGFDTTNVTDMSCMFRNCSALTDLDVSGLETTSVLTMQGMFQDCDKLTSVTGLGAYDTAAVENMSYMFKGCVELYSLTFGDSFKTTAVTTMEAMFEGCSSLKTLGLTKFVTTSVTNMSGMFSDCSGLTSLDVSGFDTSNVENMSYMFAYCRALTTLDVSGFSTAAVTNMEALFRGCAGLTQLDVSSLDTSSVTNMVYMFRDLNITELDLSGFNTVSVTDMTAMFNGCSKLTTIFVSADLWTTENVTASSTMFYGCKVLVGGAGTTLAAVDEIDPIDGNEQTAKYACIDGGIDSDTPGYLTDINPVPTGEFTLKTGTDFNTAVTALISSSGATKLQFGSWDAYGKGNFTWSDGTDVGVEEGTIKAFTSGDTVYILSGGNMYANENCSRMFYDMRALTAIDGLSAVDTSNVTDMSRMFNICTGLKSLDLSSLNTSNVTTMSNMFNSCERLTSLNLSSLNTSNVTTMLSMFSYCYSLSTLDLSGWDTSSVEDMTNMFYSCESLTELDLSDFDTGKVKSMLQMFSHCESLTELDLSGFDTSSVEDMDDMFYYCSSLTELDLSGFDTSSVTSMYAMFSSCTKLKTIYVSELWTVAGLTNSTSSMFSSCSALVGGQGTTWSSSNITATYAHIDGGTANPGYLTEIPTYTLTTGSAFNTAIKGLFSSTVTKVQFGSFSKYGAANGLSWDTYEAIVDADSAGTIRLFTSGDTVYVLSQNVSRIAFNANSSGMFRHNYSSNTDSYIPYGSITAIEGLGRIDTSNVTNMSTMFLNCTYVAELDISNWDTGSVTTMNAMFFSCSRLTSFDLSKWNTAMVTNMREMFRYCSGLTAIDISGFDMSNVSNTVCMFEDCAKLVTLKLPEKFITSKATMINHMFHGCTKLPSIDVSGWDTSNVQYMNMMFDGCKGLTSLDLSNFDTSKVTNMGSMFSNCTGLTSLNLSSFDTSKVTSMYGMFSNCTGLTSLDLSNFETSAVTNMTSMFYGCTKLATIYATPGFTTAAITEDANDDNMFSGCTALVGGEGTAYNASYIDKTYAKIDGGTSDPGYFTYGAVLKTGQNMNNYFWNDNPTTIVFGKYSDYSATVGTWTSGTVLDSRNVGTIRGFKSGTTLYVLTRSGEMRLNENCEQMFRGDYSRTFNLTTIEGLDNLDTSKVKNMALMFELAKKLTALDLSSWDTSNVTTMEKMFHETHGLSTLNVSGWNTSKVTKMNNMIYNCDKLTTLDLTSFTVSSSTVTTFMLGENSGLTTVYVSSSTWAPADEDLVLSGSDNATIVKQ